MSNNSSLSSSFSKIETPADLVAKNEEIKTPIETAMEAMGQVGFKGSMFMVMWLLNNAAEWHHDVAIDKAEGRKMAAAWALDCGKLEAAMAIIRSLDFGDNNNEETQEEENTEA